MIPSEEDRIKKRLKAVARRPENQFCCDCGDKKPTWASIIVPPDGVSPREVNHMGAFCCFHCSGAHRRLGVHICFVRSVTLDDWKEKEVKAVEIGGNKRVNACFEAKLSVEEANRIKPDSRSDLEVRDQFIKAKYQRREYFDPTKYRTSSKKIIPALGMDIFAGVAEENFFSFSKRNLFARRRSSMNNGSGSMSEERLFAGVSSEDLFSASKGDIVKSFLGSSTERSTNGSDKTKSIGGVDRIDLLQSSSSELQSQSTEKSKDPPIIPNPEVQNSLCKNDHTPDDTTEEDLAPLKSESPKLVISKSVRSSKLPSRHNRHSRSPGREIKQLGRRPGNSIPGFIENTTSLPRSQSAGDQTAGSVGSNQSRSVGSNQSQSRRKKAGYSKSPVGNRRARTRLRGGRSNSGSPTTELEGSSEWKGRRGRSNSHDRLNHVSSKQQQQQEKDILVQSERTTHPSSFSAKSGRRNPFKGSKVTNGRKMSFDDDSDYSATSVKPASVNMLMLDVSDHSEPARPVSLKDFSREPPKRSTSSGTAKNSNTKIGRGGRRLVGRNHSSDSLAMRKGQRKASHTT